MKAVNAHRPATRSDAPSPWRAGVDARPTTGGALREAGLQLSDWSRVSQQRAAARSLEQTDDVPHRSPQAKHMQWARGFRTTSIHPAKTERERFRTLGTPIRRTTAFETANIWLCKAESRGCAPVCAPVQRKRYLRVCASWIAQSASRSDAIPGSWVSGVWSALLSRGRPIGPPPCASRLSIAMRLSRHAKNAMRLYRIGVDDVERTLANPSDRELDERGNLRLAGKAGDGRPILVVAAGDEPGLVITVFLRS
jgi:hypothetical protein